MITGLSHVTILVDNQDKALEFYTKKMGFDLNTDATFGPERWLTVSPKGDKHLELALVLATPDNKQLVGKQTGNLPLCSFTTADCKHTYKELSSKGVEFTTLPTEEPWGISAAFKDLYGNLFYLNQPA